MKIKHALSVLILSVLTFVALMSPANADVTAGLVSQWKGNGNGLDSVGPNTATLYGNPGFTAGVEGAAFHFDGVDDHAKMPASASLNVGLGNGFTMSAWVNPEQLATPQPIMEFNDSAGLIGVHLYAGGGALNVFANIQSTLNEAHVIQSAGAATVNQWQHLMLTYDKPSGLATLYRNGAIDAQTNLGSFTPQTNLELFFGHRSSGLGSPLYRFTGGLDDLRLYNRALTTAEAFSVYNSTAAQTTPPVLAWDLRADWSDTANPHSVWSYNEGANPLPHVNDWQSAFAGASWSQPGWARTENGTNRLPFWFQSNGLEPFGHDWLSGDVVVHTTDAANGVGNGEANVTWTSATTGAVSITGGVWMGRDIGRGNAWTLFKNGVALTSGAISSGDAYDRANPFTYALGSGGANAVTGLNVVPGDVIKLELVRTTQFGDFAGVNLHIAPVSQGFENLAWQQWSAGTGHNDHLYALYCPPGGLTWAEAAAVATQLGGTLATITSAQENAFVAAVANDAACWTQAGAQSFGPWLGGVQPAGSTEPGGGWTWTTGEPFTYTNWHAGEPNNNGGDENRVQFYTNTALTGPQWNDASATVRQRGAVIELSTGALPPPPAPGGWASVLADVWTAFDDTVPYTAGTWGTINTWPGAGADVLLRHGVALANGEYNHDHDPLTPPILLWPDNSLRVHDFNMAPGAVLAVYHAMHLYANGTSVWSNAGTHMGVNGGGQFTNEGQLTITGTVAATRSQLNNAGQLIVQGRLGLARTNVTNLGPVPGINPLVGDITFPGDGDLDEITTGGDDPGSGTLSNYGRIRKTGGSGESFILVDDFSNYRNAGITNSGRIEVLTGTLVNAARGGDAPTGLAIHVATGAAYEMRQTPGSPYESGNYLSGLLTVTGGGKFRVMPGAGLYVGYSVPATLNAPAGTMEIAGGRLDAHGTSAATNTGGIAFTAPSAYRGRQLTNAGTMTIAADLYLVSGGTDVKNGSAAQRTGILEFAGAPTIAVATYYEGNGGGYEVSNFAHLRKTGSGTARVQVIFNNNALHASTEAGRIEVQSGTLAFESQVNVSGARFDIATGAAAELRFFPGGNAGPPFINMDQTITVTGGGKLRLMPGLTLRAGWAAPTIFNASPGTFELQAGSGLDANAANSVNNIGEITFAGQCGINGNQLLNQGTLHLAAVAGANPDGDYTVAHTGAPTLAASSRILIDVNARPNAPTQWGRYGTSAALTLAGTLQINFGALTPVSGDRWKVVQFPARTGTFSSVLFANVPAGFIPSVTYTATAVEVVLTAGTSMTYAAWTAAQSFPVPADALPTADPDKDGLDNLTEAALGLNPRSAGSAAAGTPGFVTTGSEQFLTLQFTRPGGVQRITDITYHGERSTTLTDWTETGTVLEFGPVDAQGMETITVRDTTPFTAGARSLLRLRFTTP